MLALDELENGDVRVRRPPEEFNVMPDGAKAQITHEKISLHPSDSSSGTTIKHMIRQNGAADWQIDNAVFIKGPKEKLCWIARSYRCPDPRSARYRWEPRDGEKIIEINGYNPDYACLHYSLVVAHPSVNLPELPQLFNCLVLMFERFQVGLYYTYGAFPGHHYSGFVQGLSSLPRVNRGVNRRLGDGVDPLESSELEAEMISHLSHLGGILIEQLRRDAQRAGDSEEAVVTFAPLFSLFGRKPAFDDESRTELIECGAILSIPEDQAAGKIILFDI